LEHEPVVVRERLRDTLVVGPHRLVSIAPAEQLLLVVASSRACFEAAHERECASRIGPANDEIADEDEPVGALGEANMLEQLLELPRATVHVADDHRPGHAPIILRRAWPAWESLR